MLYLSSYSNFFLQNLSEKLLSFFSLEKQRVVNCREFNFVQVASARQVKLFSVFIRTKENSIKLSNKCDFLLYIIQLILVFIRSKEARLSY